MPVKIQSFAEVHKIVSANKLRQYPGAKKGYKRLFPYALPKINTTTQIPPDGTFFVVGNCFGRNIEKALTRAERRYLSSPQDLDLPGSAMEQFGRYNIFNLDVSTNEIAWARNPKDKAVNDALIAVEDEWVDMQIHWSFAHPKAAAETYRRTYNASYAAVYQADTVIVSVSGVEQWYDAQAGHYLNIMPTRRMTEDAPDRFEFHRLDVDACAASLRRFCDLVFAHSTKNPVILVTVSPVSQPSVHGPEDALVDQFLAKAIQRAAVDMVCADYERVEYLPFLETAMLSDFRFGYREASPNHTSQALANRGVADMLVTYEGPSDGATLLGAIGHTETQLLVPDFDAAIAAAETAVTAHLTNDELDLLYVKALRGGGQHATAIAYLLDQLCSGVVTDVDRHIRELLNFLKNAGDATQIDRLRVYMQDWKLDQTPLDAMLQVRQKAAGVTGAHAEALIALKQTARDGDHDTIVAQCQLLLDNDDDPLALQDRETVMVVMTQALSKLGQHAAAFPYLIDHVKTAPEPSPRLVSTLINYAKFHADIATLDTILGLEDHIKDAPQWDVLPVRRDKLQKIATS